MKYVKMLGLAAVAAMALMAFVGAGTASATEIYKGAETLKSGTVIDASLSGTATLTTTEGTLLDTCTAGTVKGTTTNNGGGAGVAVEGHITELTWTNCTEPTSTTAKGTLKINFTSGKNGTVVAGSTATEVSVNTTIFGTCVFSISSGGTIGTLTGSTTGNATFDINANATRKTGLCPSSAVWTGTYIVTSPSPFHVTGS